MPRYLTSKSSIGPPTDAGRVLWIKVCPFIRPSRQFSWNWLIFGVRGSYRGEHGRTNFFFFFKNRSRRNGQKQPKNWVFGLFRKIYLLVLSVNDVEWKYLWPFEILRKPCAWEKSDSQVTIWPKMLLANQYALIVNISIFH